MAAQGVLVHIFGENAFAVLLPSAIIGSLTVLVIYLMTSEIMRLGGLAGTGPSPFSPLCWRLPPSGTCP